MDNIITSEYDALRAKILARAHKDPQFAADLMLDAHKSLQQMGINVPKNIKLTLVMEEEQSIILFIPPPPQGIEQLSNEELLNIAAGSIQENAELLTWHLNKTKRDLQ
ncbi:MAG: hypothetical protein JHC93_06125 [Parachlamydiales bacterium]|nr:hypothetical protein [Parachlamydiales bacterium]